MINLISKDEKRAQVVSNIRRLVITITSLILLIYVVVVAGVLGWSVLWTAKEKKASSEVDSLTAQIVSYKEAEVVVRKLEARAVLVEDFLKSRGDASDAAYVIIDEGFPILRWDYAAGGAQSVKVEATSAAALQFYAEYLQQHYNQVQPSRVEWTKDQGWSGAFLLSGRKKS
jgi:hypothetical protein